MLEFLQTDRARCTGCEACAGVCRRGAVRMVEDAEGFLYPTLDLDACDECGACEVACPALDASAPTGFAEPRVLAAWSLDQRVRAKSSSGGVFSALASRVLADGGVVAGAAFDSELRVRHVLARDEDGLAPLRGSKYVQSSLGAVLEEIATTLRGGRRVLFSGTPCQVAGLVGFLGGAHPLLTTVDLVCHGVPSPGVFRDYLRERSERRRSRVVAVSFRDKARGWKRFSVSTIHASGASDLRLFDRDPFMAGFLENLYLRPSCHVCPSSSIPRRADLTLGDFWGVDRFDPTLDDDRGTSLILVNTQAGAELLERSADALTVREVPLHVAIQGNPSLLEPWAASPRRGAFFGENRARPFSARVRPHLTRDHAWNARVRRKATRVCRGLLTRARSIAARVRRSIGRHVHRRSMYD